MLLLILYFKGAKGLMIAVMMAGEFILNTNFLNN